MVWAEFKWPLGLAYDTVGNVSLGQLEAQDRHAVGWAERALIQSACFLVT